MHVTVEVALSLYVTLDVALPLRRLPNVVHEAADGYGSALCLNYFAIQLTDKFLDILFAVNRKRRRHRGAHRGAHFRGRPGGGISLPRTPSKASSSASSSGSATLASPA